MLAERLGLSLQRCQAETTSTEFLEWQQFFRQDTRIPKMEHFYLAQIAAEVRRAAVKNPATVQVEDFVFKFEEPRQPKPITLEEVEMRTINSKAAWFALLGVKKEGTHQ